MMSKIFRFREEKMRFYSEYFKKKHLPTIVYRPLNHDFSHQSWLFRLCQQLCLMHLKGLYESFPLMLSFIFQAMWQQLPLLQLDQCLENALDQYFRSKQMCFHITPVVCTMEAKRRRLSIEFSPFFQPRDLLMPWLQLLHLKALLSLLVQSRPDSAAQLHYANPFFRCVLISIIF